MSGKRRAAGPAQKTPRGASSKAPAKGASQATGKNGRPPRTTKQRVLRVAKWMGIAALAGLLLMTATFVYLYKTIDIPDPNHDFETQTSLIYYSDGKTELGRFATQNRIVLTEDQMPEQLRDAVVSAENRSFWTDKGIDPKGILRAAFSNASGNSTQGASTITQQYVKILYLTQERSYKRKIKEAILSLKLQREKSKSEILTGYLNTIYFGRGAYGVEAAAQAYFKKHAKALDLRECAVLASVLNNPSGLDPANGKASREALKERYDYVLNGMASSNTASQEEVDRAERRLPKFAPVNTESTYGGQRGHMLKLVKDELHQLGYSDEEIDGGGLRVTTTFTRKAMSAAKKGVLEARPDGFSDKHLHIAVASVEPGTGALRGFYGGQNYLRSQINWAEAGGMVGSTFKPFTLATALENGYSLKDTFDGNSPYEFPGGLTVRNEGTGSDGLGDDYGAAVNAVYALEQSINTAYVDMSNSIPDGPDKILETANKLGVPPSEPSKKYPGIPDNSRDLDADALITLGKARVSAINMANAYATIANGGQRADVHVIEKVVEPDGKTWNYKNATTDAIDEDIAADTSYALQQVVQHGTGQAALALGRPAAGKTGTATNADDAVSSAWFIGYTPQLSTAVMYVRGDGDNQLDGWLPSYFGADYPADTWNAVMTRDMVDVPVEQFPPPANVDGTAPEDGHAPYVPPPPTHTQKPSKTPSTETPTPTPTPTETPSSQTPTPTPTQTPSPTCTILGGCNTPTPTPTPTQSTPPSGSPSASQQREREGRGA